MKLSVIKYFLIAGCLVGGLGSCLKDKNVEDQVYGMENKDNTKVIEFHESEVIVAVPIADKDTLVSLGTAHLSAAPSAQDVPVNISLANSATMIDDYNTEHGTALEELPSSLYTPETANFAVVIPKGTNDADIRITINPANLDPSVTYALGLTLEGNQQAGFAGSENYGHRIFILSVKNKYDGIYTLRMKLEGWSAFGIADGVSEEFPEDIELQTKNGTTVSIFTHAFGNILQPGFTGGVGFVTDATQFGSAAPEYVFDPVTDALVSVQNSQPDDGRGRTFVMNPAVTDSRYDPATGTIYAAYYMTQNGRPNLYIYDTMTYNGPR